MIWYRGGAAAAPRKVGMLRDRELDHLIVRRVHRFVVAVVDVVPCPAGVAQFNGHTGQHFLLHRDVELVVHRADAPS
jgi:hypothetical protein